MTSRSYQELVLRHVAIIIALAFGSIYGPFYTIPSEVESKDDETSISRYSCPNYGYTNGSWVLEGESENSNSTNSYTTVVYNPYGYPKYDWKLNNPTECQLEDWDLNLFCETLGGRSILLVGDSISLQFYDVLLEILLNGTNITTKVDERNKQRVQKYGTICNINNNNNNNNNNDNNINSTTTTGSKFAFVRNDHLTMALDDSKESAEPWISNISDYPILVLNTGAHPKPLDQHTSKLQTVKNALEKNNYNGTVFVRTTPRGHIGCHKQDIPMKSERDDDWERFFPTQEDQQPRKYKKYHYAWFPEENQVYKQLFGESNNHTNNYVVLDVQRITELRPDGHAKPPADCLHYRNYEIYHAWAWLFLNGLRGNFK